ncbi:PepSY-associated TM helix domain-containing protein [Hyphomonas chukchiensis]|uniref:PepSY-associated TM helix domain-containing protein n=1 Tax=Hyphomonas chukchiensis TaxID=1280947 RepID=UPI0030F95BF9
MNRERHKRNYDLHSWTGIALGLIVFVVAFTGCFALFHDEIRTWEDPALRETVSDAPAPIAASFETWLDEVTGGEPAAFASLYPPSEDRPFYEGYVFDAENALHEARWSSVTGDRLPDRGAGLSTWLLDIHRDFMWPDFLGGRTFGRGLVGIAGIVLLLAILTGVIAHTKIREEAYTMRLKRSPRLKWQDSHKVIGLWGLPFFIMISFTGAVLGVVALLAPIVAAIAFKGDVEALEHAIFGDHPEPTGQQVQMISLDQLQRMRHPESGYLPEFISMEHYGDEAAVFNIFYAADTELLMYDIVSLSGATGKRVVNEQLEATNAASRATGAMAPLHYATYGGVWLKFLYLVLGLGLAVITALGSMMWVERRKHGNEGSKSAAFYDRLSHLNTGVVMGLPVASLALFHLDKLYTGAEAARLVATGWTYFAVWGAALTYAFIRRNDYAATRELMTLAGALALAIPLTNGVMTGDWVWLRLASGHTQSGWVDVCLALFGGAAIFVAMALPRARREKSRTPQSKHSEPVPAE